MQMPDKMSDKMLARYQEWLARSGISHSRHQGVLWYNYNHMVVPLGPASTVYVLNHQESKELLGKIPGVLIRWTGGLDSLASSEWYSIICDCFVELENIPSQNTRSKIRRGIRACRVEPVTAKYIAEHGYESYLASHARYLNKSIRPQSAKQFVWEVQRDMDFDDIIHYWGIWRNSKLVGYSRNLVYDDISVDYETIRLAPEGLSKYAAYALYYTMNRYYLRDKGVGFVNSGSRNLLHKTEVQDFLVSKLQFRRSYMKLELEYRWPLGGLIRIGYPVRRILTHLDERIGALYLQEQIRRSCCA